MKKIMALLLVGLMALNLTACAGSGKKNNGKKTADGISYEINELGLPVVSEPIALTVMGSKHPIQGEWATLSIWKWLSEQTNIDFEFNTPVAEGYGEKKNLAFASNELPDVFIGGGLSTNDELKYGMNQELLLPLDEMFDVAPNIKKMFKENPNWLKSLSMPDEHLYSLPQDFVGFGLYRYSWINNEWLTNLGLSMPSTIDGFYNVLKAFKNDDPNKNGKKDEIPLSFTNEMYDHMRSTILSAFGYLSGSYEVKNDKVVYAPTTNEYKEYIKFMNKLWKEGLIDPDSFSQNLTQQSAKGKSGNLGMFAYIADYVVAGTENAKQYKVLEPMTSSFNSTKESYGVFPVMGGTAAITNVNPYPEIAMRLLDWFYTETGALCLINGVEGEDWERTSDGGMTFKVPKGKNKEEYRGGMITSDCGTVLPRYTKYAEEVIIGGAYKTNAPLEANIHYQVMDTIAPFARIPMPTLSFTEEEHKTITSRSGDIATYITQTEAQFIVGDLDINSKWNDYVKTLDSMGVSDMLKIYEDAYARYTK